MLLTFHWYNLNQKWRVGSQGIHNVNDCGRGGASKPRTARLGKGHMALHCVWRCTLASSGQSSQHEVYVSKRVTLRWSLEIDGRESVQNKLGCTKGFRLQKWAALLVSVLLDPLLDRSYTFWDWFYALMKLIREHLKGPWTDGCILGFISNKQAEEILSSCPTGTFLLRFSDSVVGCFNCMNKWCSRSVYAETIYI